jgi:dihydroflavonol-4-reductase
MVFAFWASFKESDPRNLGLRNMTKRILVTGANGFVGSHLVEGLLSRGYQVRCMVRRTSDLSYIRHLPVELAYADVQDTESLREACQDLQAVCHCAALTRAIDEETYFRVNTLGTESLARACLDANPNLERFLFLSSQTACGPSTAKDDFLDETRPPQPISWYGKSKLTAERALSAMADRLPLTIVRSSAVYGPRDRDFFTYFELVKRGLSLQLGRDGRRIRLIYVRDLVTLLVLTLESTNAVGQTYFGCAEDHTYSEFSDAVSRALNKRPLRIIVPEAALVPMALWAKVQTRLTGKPPLLHEQRIDEMRQLYWLCSGEKAQGELGFRPEYDLDTGVQETAHWYLENGWL